MSDDFLPYYEKELTYLKQLGARFANEHPKVAGHLGISTESVEDPHVSRLIESVAFLNARIQRRMDDGYAELADSLLEVLYPHFLKPIPPFTIARFDADPELLDEPYFIPRHTEFDSAFFSADVSGSNLESSGQDYESCRFRTTEDLTLLPIAIKEAQVYGRPFNTPGASSVRQAESVIKISLQTLNKDILFSQLSIDSLKLFVVGNHQYSHTLFEFLARDCVSLVIKDPSADGYPHFVSHDSIKMSGFRANESLLPYSANTFSGYVALTEFFSFPEKFFFIHITDIAKIIADAESNQLDFYFYISASDMDLEHQLSKDSFALNCCPMTNLFSHQGDPQKVDQTKPEIHIEPDARRPRSLEVYSIDKLSVSSDKNTEQIYLPLYGAKQAEKQNNGGDHYYLSHRRPAKEGYGTRDDGSDVSISFQEQKIAAEPDADLTLHLSLTCSNRDLVAKLPFNAEQPILQACSLSIPCQRIQCIVQPTRSYRSHNHKRSAWKFVSQLSLNHLSISGGENAAASLKEILSLYDFKQSSINRSIVESIISVRSRRISAPLSIDGRIAVCQGSEIEVVLDKSKLTGGSAYLFAKTLEHFFSVYASVNSFTRTIVRFQNVEQALLKGQPRAGERLLV